MQRDYICCRELVNGAIAFLVKESDDTVTVHAHFPHTPSDEYLNEHRRIASVPEELIDEIEARPTWNSPMSNRLQAFAEQLWDIVQKLDSWYVFC